MKKKAILAIVFFIGFISFKSSAQDANAFFFGKFPELKTTLNPNSNAKINNSNLKLFREKYKQLSEAFKDVEKVQNDVGKDNTVILDYKGLKDLSKDGQLDSLGKIIKKSQSDIKMYVGRNVQYGVDSIECIQELSNFRNLIKSGDNENAFIKWKMLYQYYPKSNKYIYSKGDVLLKDKIKEARNNAAAASRERDGDKVLKYVAERQMWIDKLMEMYDQQIEMFPKTKYTALADKGNDLHTYRVKKNLTSDEKAKADSNLHIAYKYLKEAVEGESKEPKVTIIFGVQNLYFVSEHMQERGQHDCLQVVDDFNFCQDVSKKMKDFYTHNIEVVTKQNPNDKRIKRWQGYLDKYINPIDSVLLQKFANGQCSQCGVLVPALEPKFEENKENVVWLEKVGGLLASKGDTCTDSKLFEEVALALYKLKPSANAARLLATIFLKKEDFDQALKYLEESYTQETDSVKKSQSYFGAAKILELKKDYSKARNMALEAIKYNPQNGAPYIVIARMYANTSSSSGDNEVTKCYGYLVAVDKLLKAKSIDPSVADEANGLIGKYRGGFPKTEPAFDRGINKGDVVKAGGWIQETTTVRFRD